MQRSNKYDIVMELSSISHLFNAPEVNPFSNNELEIMGESALARLLRQLESQPLNRRMCLTLLLPVEQIKPDLEQEVLKAMNQYCCLNIKNNKVKLQILRQFCWRSLLNGLTFLAVCLLLSNLFHGQSLSFVPEFIRSIFSEGFTIIGWVALWHPVEIVLYDWIPIARTNAIYKFIITIPIYVSPKI
jgi:hypothetical protein